MTFDKYRKEIADAVANVSEDQVKSVLKEELSRAAKQTSDEEVEKLFKQLMDSMKKFEEGEKADKILNHLEIPCSNGVVQSADLVEILMDEKKLKELLSRINMKAFW